MTKRFSASSAAQLMTCPGSANLEQAIPGYEEPPKQDRAGAKGVGTDIHALFEEAVEWFLISELPLLSEVLGEYRALHWRKRREIVADELSIEKWLVDTTGSLFGADAFSDAVVWFQRLAPLQLPPSMLLYMSQTLAYVAELFEKYPVANIWTEHQMTASWLASGPGTTVDLVIAGTDVLTVVDYKTGTIPVDVVDNDQLMFYAMSAYTSLYSETSKPKKIVMHILQPKNLTSHEITTAELLNWARKARAADLRILKGDLTLVPSDHCTFCPANPHMRGQSSERAKAKCPAMLELLYPPVMDHDAILNM